MLSPSHLFPIALALAASHIRLASAQSTVDAPAYNPGGGGAADGRVDTAWLGFGFTNLSPEIHYTPPLVPGHDDPDTGWVVTRNSSYTRMPEASVSWQYWGEGCHAYGQGSWVEERVQSAMDVDKVAPDGTERWGFPSRLNTGSVYNTLWRTQMNLEGVPIDAWNITLSTPNETIRASINLSRIDLMTQLPSRNSPSNPDGLFNTTFVYTSALDNGSLADYLADPETAWSLIVPEYNNSRNERIGGWSGYRSSSPETVTSNWGGQQIDNIEALDGSSDLITTNTTNAPLRWVSPPRMSYLQVMGAVGPDQGAFELRLLPRSEPSDTDDTFDFNPHPLVRPATANRPIEAIAETLSVAWLDPRIRYDIELVLTEQGRNLSVHGVSFAGSMDEDDDRPINNWWEARNTRLLEAQEGSGGGGLSGGQIAGIVVGSVAGAALLAGLTFWLWRRNKRAKAPEPILKDTAMDA